EQGWIGLTLFGAIVVATFRKGLRSVRVAEDNFLRTIQIGMLAFLLGVLLNFCFMPGGLLNNFIWIAVGLVFSLAGLIDDANEVAPDKLPRIS
ncbi:hypothetical protein KAH55_02495, partial [bacterium]|nr:hypothetical protein [bacterium]